MARSTSFALLTPLLLIVVTVQLMASVVLSSADEPNKLPTAPIGLNSKQDGAAEGSRDLSYLRQLLGEKYTSLEGASSNDEEASLKRRGIELLLKLLSDADIKGSNQRKRTCKVNLGGNCATEDALSMADHWHFMNSAFSPGRRRRSAPAVLPLISGASRKLLNVFKRSANI